MGAVIAFAPPSRRRSRPDRDADAPTGEILLFLGVRYERQDEQPAPPRSRRRTGRRATGAAPPRDSRSA